MPFRLRATTERTDDGFYLPGSALLTNAPQLGFYFEVKLNELTFSGYIIVLTSGM